MDQETEIWTRECIFLHIKSIKEQSPFPTIPDFKIFCNNVFFHPGGKALRLSKNGVAYLEKYYPSYIINITEFEKSGNTTQRMPSKHYVFLTRFCRKPYYIGLKKIIFFDEEEAFVFKLCDGDINNVKIVAPEKLK